MTIIDIPVYDELDPKYIPVVENLIYGTGELKLRRKPITKLLRNHLVAVRGEFCQDCEGEIFDTIHHRDYDPSNNEPYNLLLLCYKCHMKRHKHQYEE